MSTYYVHEIDENGVACVAKIHEAVQRHGAVGVAELAKRHPEAIYFRVGNVHDRIDDLREVIGGWDDPDAQRLDAADELAKLAHTLAANTEED